MKFIIALVFSLTLFIVNAQYKKVFMIVGTYTSGKSEGIYVYKVKNTTAKADSITMIKTKDPSFLVVNDRNFLYAVNEIANNGNGGTVSAFSFDKKNGSLKFINSRSTGGDHPCHISLDRTRRWIAVSNYSSGSFSILPVSNDGGLDSSVITIQHVGSSVNKERQKSAHAHCAVFSEDNKYLLVADLGVDKVMVYPFNHNTGAIDKTNIQYVDAKPGAGPRQITFDNSGKFSYVIEELTGTVSVYKFDKGKLELIQNIPSTPKDFNGFAGSADIHVSGDGKFLYASNRGELNSIAIFKINKTGMLDLVGHQSTLGVAPRYFSFVPWNSRYLMAANQNSDEIVIFKRNKNSGLLTDTGKRIKVGKPVCIQWSYISK
jgi:6-phosphogluconolactonase